MSNLAAKNAIQIAEIKSLEAGNPFVAVGILLMARERFTKTQQPFWEVTIMDASGMLDAKIWSDGKWWDLREGSKKAFTPDKASVLENAVKRPVGVKGVVAEYRGKLQYNFIEICLLDPLKYPLESFLRKSPIPLEDMLKEFWALVHGCDEPLRSFLSKVYSGEFLEQFQDAPAALSYHHAYVHGLLEHTLAVTKSAKAIGESYLGRGLKIDMNVLIAGGLLHDIGKLDAYCADPLPGMTIQGAVIDHIPLGYAMFMKLAKAYGLDEETTLEIGHILVSHHGKREYGSPVLPSTLEALIVSAADELDFLMFCWNSAEGADDLDLSEFHKPAQRRFWKKPSQVS